MWIYVEEINEILDLTFVIQLNRRGSKKKQDLYGHWQKMMCEQLKTSFAY